MGKYRKNTKMPDDGGRFPLFPKLIATSFGFGFLPVAPGTWGALFAILAWLPLYLWTSASVTIAATAIAIVVFTILGTWASSVSERYWGPDPVVACVDETVGQWISLLPVVERLPRGYGMMADDILAGLYSAAILIGLNILILR